MRHTLAAVLCVVIPIAVLAADNGYKVTCDGGSLTDARAGIGIKIYIEATDVRFVKDKSGCPTARAFRDLGTCLPPRRNLLGGL